MFRIRTARAVAVIAALVGVLTLLGGLAPAAAETTTADCQAQIAALRTATLNATFVGQNALKEQTGLVGKLDSAAAKLDQGKFADALQALTQFRDKVVALDAQGKIDPADSQVLIAGANDAIACVQSLTT